MSHPVQAMNIPMHLPDYTGGSIVNLMSSVIAARGGGPSEYPALKFLPPFPLSDVKNIVVLVIDGLGYEFLEQVGGGGTLHQHLRARMTSVFPSTTASAITTFLTGTAPQQHGLTGWHVYLKEFGNVLAVLPFRPRHGGSSLGGSGVDAARFFGHTSVFDKLLTRSYQVVPKRIAHSDFNLAHSGQASIITYKSLSRFFGGIKGVLRDNGERKYVYAYWPELDSTSHIYGVGSAESARHFSQLDEAFGRFLNCINRDETTVIVTADHGLIDSSPDRLIELENHPELAQTLVVPLCGERRVAYCYVHPHKQERFEAYVQTELAQQVDLVKSHELIERGFFGLGQSHPRLADRVGHYTLIMRENYVIRDRVLGEERYDHIGVHGGVSRHEMYVPLIVA